VWRIGIRAGVGRNFAAHAAELGNDLPTTPLIFLKPVSSYVFPPNPIQIPQNCNGEVHHEGQAQLYLICA